MKEEKTIVVTWEGLLRMCDSHPATPPTPAPQVAPAPELDRWPECRRPEPVDPVRAARSRLLCSHPEIWAGVGEHHDDGDADDGVVSERGRIRNWAADMLDAEVGR